MTSDAHWEYVDFTMKASIGDDWLYFFDYCFVITNATRFANEYTPFFSYDPTTENCHGEKFENVNKFIDCAYK